MIITIFKIVSTYWKHILQKYVNIGNLHVNGDRIVWGSIDVIPNILVSQIQIKLSAPIHGPFRSFIS